MISDKIRPHHLARKALLYVRHSSVYQVLRNREGRALQYAVRDRPTVFGWSEIDVIDDDLGRSGAGGAGFERMVAEVCVARVGTVAAPDVSRHAKEVADSQRGRVSRGYLWIIFRKQSRNSPVKLPVLRRRQQPQTVG